jgi:Xaa-Pro aminopeptidase
MKRKLLIRLLAMALSAVALRPAASLDDNVFALRRERLRAQINGTAILYSGSDATVGLDKNFYYLTGIAVPDAFLLIGSDSTADKLFLDLAASPIPAEDIVRTSAIGLLFGRAQVGLALTDALARDPDAYFPYSYAPSDPVYLYPSCLAVEGLLAGQAGVRRNNLASLLYPLRMIKDVTEIALLAQAAEVTGRGVLAGMAALRPGMLESDLQDVMEGTWRSLGAPWPSFSTIIGSGPNSLILHYQENTRRMAAGEVVVIDVGAEFARYAGDITRTLPVSGVFTARQREVYDILLECQRRAITACRPGATLSAMHEAAKAYAEEKGYGAYFNFSGWRHGTSHHLGLDVHDPSVSNAVLAVGMVVTVEPGIYIPGENLGVRIEDDVLIIEKGCFLLSNIVPRTADGIEAVIAGGIPSLERGDVRWGTLPPPARIRAIR